MQTPRYEQLLPHIPRGDFVAEDVATRAHMTVQKARHGLYELAKRGHIERLPRQSGEPLRYRGRA